MTSEVTPEYKPETHPVDIPELSNQEAAKKLQEWVIQNYKALKIDNQTISNYMQNSNFEMQIWGLRNSSI